METNVKMVGFANQSINGVTVANEGFDMEYDGKKMDISGFSGDKLYYAKLNNKQLVNLLNIPSTNIPLERRILSYGKPSKKHSIKKIKMKPRRKTRKPASIKIKKISPITMKANRRKSSSKYVSPTMRSEYKKSNRYSKYSTHSSKRSNKSSIRKTIY